MKRLFSGLPEELEDEILGHLSSPYDQFVRGDDLSHLPYSETKKLYAAVYLDGFRIHQSICMAFKWTSESGENAIHMMHNFRCYNGGKIKEFTLGFRDAITYIEDAVRHVHAVNERSYTLRRPMAPYTYVGPFGETYNSIEKDPLFHTVHLCSKVGKVVVNHYGEVLSALERLMNRHDMSELIDNPYYM